MQEPERIWHYVAPSDLHGQGVFARYDIPAGTVIMEYKGKRISPEQADEQPSADPDNPYHTFFFALSSGDIIDGAQQGNEARWINHSCEPNCEGHENEAGDQVFIIAKRDKTGRASCRVSATAKASRAALRGSVVEPE